MAPNLPNIARVTKAAAATTPGRATGAAIGGVKVPKTLNQKSLFGNLPKAQKPQTQHSPNDQFTLPLPYSNIPQTAQTQYASDAALAKQNAALGYLTPDQQTARAAQQGANVQSLYANLAQQIAGIQHVGVDQTNAGTAALGAQNAAAGATGNPVASVTGTVNPGVTGNAGAQAVLASQGAGQGNFLGALQANALSSGTVQQQHALAQGQSNIQTDQANQQKTLASLLSGLATPSSREATMTNANQGVRASNLQTGLSLYQQGVSQQEQYAALGQKDKADAQGRANAVLLAQINQGGENRRTQAQITAANQRANNANKTRLATTATTQAGADRRAKAAAAAKAKAAALAASKKTGGTGPTGTGDFKNYKVTVLLPSSTVADPTTGKIKLVPAKRVVKTVPANVWNRFSSSGPQGKRKLKIIGVPEGSKIQSSTGY